MIGGWRHRHAEDGAHSRFLGARVCRLLIIAVGTHIADMRKGEEHDLPGIGGIGEDFLVAGHGGVEAELAHRRADMAPALAEPGAPVGEHERSTCTIGGLIFGHGSTNSALWFRSGNGSRRARVKVLESKWR